MDFGKGTKFWQQFPFLRSAVGSDGQPIIPHPETFEDFSVEIAEADDLTECTARRGTHGETVCVSFQKSVYALDGEGRVVATPETYVEIGRRDVRFKHVQSDDVPVTIGMALLDLEPALHKTIRYLVIVEQDYTALKSENWSESCIRVLIIPSAEALRLWLTSLSALQKKLDT